MYENIFNPVRACDDPPLRVEKTDVKIDRPLSKPSLRLAFFQVYQVGIKHTRSVVSRNEAEHSPLRNRLSATRAFLLSGPVLARLALAPIHSHFIVCNMVEKCRLNRRRTERVCRAS